MLQYLTRKEVDTARWDRCLQQATNSLIYATADFLDHMADQWDAVVYKDYEAVMPLPFRKKYGIRYVMMPAFLQQAGIFSVQPLTTELLKTFRATAEKKFRFGDYHFNYENSQPGFALRNNFIVSLQPPYEKIKKKYRHDLQKNLARAERFSLSCHTTDDLEQAIALFQLLYQQKQGSVRDRDYLQFEKLCRLLQGQGKIVARKIILGDELLSTAICLKDHRRLYLLLSATTAKGRTLEANHFLIDRIIAEHAGTPLLLDFEGSDLPGIAHFYQNFGAINQPYFYHRWNRLPWPLKR